MSQTPRTHELALGLGALWDAAGVNIRPGVSDEEIEAYETRRGVALPDDFRAYLSVVDGMNEDDLDDQLFQWLPLGELQNVAADLSQFTGIPDYGGITESLADAHEWHVFIDYLITSHVYAVRLTASRRPTTPVILICGSNHRRITDTFSEFLEAYLADSEAVLFARDRCSGSQ